MYNQAVPWYNTIGVTAEWLPAAKQYRVVKPDGTVLVYDSILEVIELCEKHGYGLKLKEGLR